MARKPTGGIVTRQGKNGTTYQLRFLADGRRQYLTLGSAADGWDRAKAEAELQNVLADVRRGVWKPPAPARAPRDRPGSDVPRLRLGLVRGTQERMAGDDAGRLRMAALPPPAAVLSASSPVADHDRRGGPLPAGQGGRRRAERHLDQQDPHPPGADPRGRRRARADHAQRGEGRRQAPQGQAREADPDLPGPGRADHGPAWMPRGGSTPRRTRTASSRASSCWRRSRSPACGSQS